MIDDSVMRVLKSQPKWLDTIISVAMNELNEWIAIKLNEE
jgi:hypothetical protein